MKIVHICVSCGEVTEGELPFFCQGHSIGGRTFYEGERAIYDCKHCGRRDTLAKGYICADCEEPVLEWEAELEYDTGERLCKGCYGRRHPEELEEIA